MSMVFAALVVKFSFDLNRCTARTALCGQKILNAAALRFFILLVINV